MKRAIFAALLAGSLMTSGAWAQAPAPEAAKPEAAKPEPGPGQEPDPAIIRDIMTCIADGLPTDWRKTWFIVKQTDRNALGNAREFEASFFYATSENDMKGRPLKPCGAEQVIDGVGKLNAYLPESQRRWTGATFTFFRDGRYNAAYDQTPFKSAPAKPAAKAPAKKKQETAK